MIAELSIGLGFPGRAVGGGRRERLFRPADGGHRDLDLILRSRQAGDDGCSRRRILREVRDVGGVHLLELGAVGDVDARSDDVLEAEARGLQQLAGRWP